MKLPFGWEIARRQKTADRMLTLASSRPQSSRSYANPLQMPYLKSEVDYEVYDVIARGMPFIDRAIGELARMTMGFEVTCDAESTKEALSEWLNTVNANGLRAAGFWPVWRSHIAQMLQYGHSALEIVPAPSRRDVAAVYTVDRSRLQLIPGQNGDVLLGERTQNGQIKPYTRQDLFAYSAINSKGDSPLGRSILAAIPFVADIVLRMENAVRQKWQRHGAPSFLVNYRIRDDVAHSDEALGAIRAQLQDDWYDSQRARWNQEGILDFIAATQGDFIVQAITDGQELDFNIPYRALVEQVVSALHLPPFMLGLQWSTTERLSQQQANAINGTISDFRLELEADVLWILRTVAAYRGLKGEIGVEWNDTDLQDRVESAKAELTEAQALKQRMDNALVAWRNGWVDQEQAAEMAGLEIDGVALVIDMPAGGQIEPSDENPDDDEERQEGEQEAAEAVASARARALWTQYP